MTLSQRLTDASSRRSRSSDRSKKRGAFERVLRFAAGPHVLAAADQSIVSATSFLTLIAIARWTDAGQLGSFVLGNSIIGVLAAIQHAMVASPYAIQRHSAANCGRERAMCCLVQSSLLAAAAIAALVTAEGISIASNVPNQTAVLIWALACAVPVVLLREFARELSFAHFRLVSVFTMDLATAAVQILLLFVLASSRQISAASALAVIAASNAAPALLWFYLNRDEFAWPRRLKPLLSESWRLGKWLLLSRSAILVQGYAGYWLTMLLAGAAMTGVYAACMSVVSFANPVLFGLYNFLTPRAALTLKESGNAGLRKKTIADTLLLGCVMGAFTFFIAIAGKWIMRLLYSSVEYSGHEHVAVVLAIAMLISAVGIPPSNALASMERGRSIAAISIGAAGLQVLILSLLLPALGLVGAAISAVVGGAAATIARWIVFCSIIETRGPTDRENDAIQVIAR